MTRLAILTLLVPLALVGCELPAPVGQVPAPPTTALTPAPQVADAPAAIAPAPVAAVSAAPVVARDPNNPLMPALPTGAVQQQQAFAAPIVPATLRPGDLSGLTKADVLALLGPPDLDRREGNSEALLYSGAGCVLHLFLYPPAAGGAFRVDTTQVGPDNRDKTVETICLNGLRQRGVLAAAK